MTSDSTPRSEEKKANAVRMYPDDDIIVADLGQQPQAGRLPPRFPERRKFPFRPRPFGGEARIKAGVEPGLGRRRLIAAAGGRLAHLSDSI